MSIGVWQSDGNLAGLEASAKLPSVCVSADRRLVTVMKDLEIHLFAQPVRID